MEYPEEEVWHVLEGEVEITLDAGRPSCVPVRPWSCPAASATKSARSAQRG
jgi:mannose-6-phosphate isomerase-like protein (cupin superfamily)